MKGINTFGSLFFILKETNMTEGEIRQLALLHSYIAELEEVKVEVEAMNVANKFREIKGMSPAYGEDAFRTASESISHIAWKMKNKV